MGKLDMQFTNSLAQKFTQFVVDCRKRPMFLLVLSHPNYPPKFPVSKGKAKTKDQTI